MNGSSSFLIEAKGSYIVKDLKDNSSIQRIETGRTSSIIKEE